MPTSYPGSLDSFTNKVDGTSDVLAADINNLQDAVAAIQTRLGLSSSGANITAGGGTMTGALNSSVGFGVYPFRTTGNIGGSYVDWSNTRTPALQVDAESPTSAYMIWRATQWNSRHLAGMDAYAGGSTSSTPKVDLHVGTTTNAFVFQEGGHFTAVGNVTAYSDERLKTNWQPLAPDFLTRFSRVKTGVYDRTDTGETQVGVSAQSLREVLPQAVLEDDKGTLSVAYGNAALAACVELAKRVVEQEARIAHLEALVAKLVED